MHNNGKVTHMQAGINENWTYYCCCSVAKLSDSLLPDIPCWTALVAQTVKHLPTMWETWVQSLSQEDLLEKEMATHSSILAWKIPWTEEPGRLQSVGSQRVKTRLSDFTSLHFRLYAACLAPLSSTISPSLLRFIHVHWITILRSK